MYFTHNAFVRLYALRVTNFTCQIPVIYQLSQSNTKLKEIFVRPSSYYFVFYKKIYHNSSCTFLYNIPGSKLYYDWCRSCLTSLRVSHLYIADCRKFKCPLLGIPPNGIRSKLRFAKICHLGKNVKRTNTHHGLRSLITSFSRHKVG
jgi:hypothetical protein